MKGICHIWSRGRLISPSLPVGDDWYLNLSSQKRSPGRNLGEHRWVRRSSRASRGTVVLIFYLRMRRFARDSALRFLPHSWEKISTYNRLITICWQRYYNASSFHNVHEPVVWSWELEVTLFSALPKAVLNKSSAIVCLIFQQYQTSCSRENLLQRGNHRKAILVILSPRRKATSGVKAPYNLQNLNSCKLHETFRYTFFTADLRHSCKIYPHAQCT